MVWLYVCLIGTAPILWLLIGYVIAVKTKKTRNPKNYSTPVPPKVFPPVRTKKDDCTTDAYKARKIPSDVDYVIIGSGIGGLYCGAVLAKCGKKVVVLEQHYVAGGCLHEFEEEGWTFDTGLHYVGSIEKYKTLLDLVTDEDATPVEWEKVGSQSNDYCYDKIALEQPGAPPTVFEFPAGKNKFVEAVAKEFPEERKAIEKYVELVLMCNKKGTLHFFGKLFPAWFERLLSKTMNKEFETLACKTVQEVLDGLTDNKKLKALLVGQYGDYGLPPAEASFFIHCGVVSHFLEGGYYPVGGPQKITRALIPTIERAGGRVLVKANVAEVIVKNDMAVGVRMQNGEEVMAGAGVISSAGAINTFHYLLSEEMKKKVLPSLPASVQQPVETGVSHIYLFVGLDGTNEELGIDGANLWRVPITDDEYNINQTCKNANDMPFNEENEITLFIGFPSAKDPEWPIKHPGRSSCIIITEAKEEWFEPERFGNAASGKRGAAYTELLNCFKDRLLSGLYKYYPKTKGKIAFSSMASPLSNKYYLARSASYGLPASVDRFSSVGGLRPHTPIQNLWLTGQDICSAGIAGALSGGLITAHGVLGYGVADLMLYDRNLVDDMMNLDQRKTKSKAI